MRASKERESDPPTDSTAQQRHGLHQAGNGAPDASETQAMTQAGKSNGSLRSLGGENAWPTRRGTCLHFQQRIALLVLLVALGLLLDKVLSVLALRRGRIQKKSRLGFATKARAQIQGRAEGVHSTRKREDGTREGGNITPTRGTATHVCVEVAGQELEARRAPELSTETNN